MKQKIEKLTNLNTAYRERRVQYGYCETYEVVEPTEENLTKIVEKINELIDYLKEK